MGCVCTEAKKFGMKCLNLLDLSVFRAQYYMS